MRRLALAALLALAACHRPQADQPVPGADGEAQANTAAKTIADLQAADDASRGPPPAIAPARPPRIEAPRPKRETPEPADADSDTVETNAD